MKILVIADSESSALYGNFDPERFLDIDVVISCGDLSPGYMEFIISMLNVPCYYVPGNHDVNFVGNPPLGWKPLDGQLVCHDTIKILGLGGSMRYKPGPHQYTEFEMRNRFFKLKPFLWWQNNTIDILVTHAPAYQLGDLEDLPHQGFRVFRDIIDTYKPKYHLHGHVHLNYGTIPRQQCYGDTVIINGYQHHVFEF